MITSSFFGDSSLCYYTGLFNYNTVVNRSYLWGLLERFLLLGGVTERFRVLILLGGVLDLSLFEGCAVDLQGNGSLDILLSDGIFVSSAVISVKLAILLFCTIVKRCLIWSVRAPSPIAVK